MVVSRETFEKLLDALENPKGPNQKLIDMMRRYVMTKEERDAQRESFVLGNVMLSRPLNEVHERRSNRLTTGKDPDTHC